MIIAKSTPCFARTVPAGVVLALLVGLSLTHETRAQLPAVKPEPGKTTTVPAGWWKNGKNHEAYVVGMDRTQSHQGQPTVHVRSIKPSVDGFGGMMQMCNADNYLGQRLQFSAWLKTKDAKDGGAHLWFRVDGKERGMTLQFDNMYDRPVKGTTDWQRYSVVLDIPENAAALAFGVFVSGGGQAWISGVQMREVGREVRSTNTLMKPRQFTVSGPIRERKLPDTPVNLRFD